MSSIYTSVWFDISDTFRSGISIAEKNLQSQTVNWNKVNQMMLGTAVVFGCKLLEQSNLRNDDITKVLFKIRNAFIHNDNDISKFSAQGQANSNAEQLVDTFISQYGDKYFEKDSNKNIIFKEPIIHLITMALLQDYQEI